MAKDFDKVFQKEFVKKMARGMIKLLVWVPDRVYLKIVYRLRTGKKLDLKNPKSFNEKINWQKIYDRNPQYVLFADKIEAKKEVAKIIGDKYIIPTLGVWNKPDEIDFASLPEQFVLKCSHNSGLGLCVCKEKAALDVQKAKDELRKGLKQLYWAQQREWCYKDIKPRILAEEYLDDGKNVVPEDFKIYCMGGKPQYIVVFHNRFNKEKSLSESVYTTNWEKLPISLDHHFAVSDQIDEPPVCLQEMLEKTSILCKDMMQVRIDWYVVNNKLYFGEMTFYTAAGFGHTIPASVDDELGELIPLNGYNQKK